MLQYKINDHYLIIKILTISNKFTKQTNKKIYFLREIWMEAGNKIRKQQKLKLKNIVMLIVVVQAITIISQ